jgi:methylated-DNA-protein-cysteine methyltransferase-like protein
MKPTSPKSDPSQSDSIAHIIIQQLASIPIGKVCTYGDLAKLAGYPSHARFVGSVLRKLPKGSKLPWHRVINGQGRISFPQDSDAYKVQQSRLEEEGIVFLNGRVKLDIYRIN